ncbi:MAG TPA: NAD(P)-dependent oxidoreductase [Candidatus Dormibacteraeota bacterium]|jgi:D-3-phosphoglycerate dehydrogenase|nr:NAD(P)-dependent oxidoreductase [Candidatus Dormibacteraeota bacterium]
MAGPDGSRRLNMAALAPGIPLEMVTLLDGAGIDVVLPPSRDQPGVHAVLADADVVLADWSGALRLGAEEAAFTRGVGYIQNAGVGTDSIDLDAWGTAGVPVAATAGANATGVAEWCIAAALSVLRSMNWADSEVRAGRWPQLEASERGCGELSGRRVGIVGFGDIGTRCAALFAAFGSEVSYWSRRRRSAEEERGATWRELDDLIARSSILVLVVPLTEDTRGLLDPGRLARMPRGAIVVNAGRGGLVDEEALIAALDSGALGGAALDVFATEPLAPGSPLRSNDRVLLSPHIAGATAESRMRIFTMIAGNLSRAMRGEPLEGVVNGAPPLVRWRR